MKIKLVLLITLIMVLLNGCSGLKDLPTLPIRYLSSENEQALVLDDESGVIQRFEIEGFTVIFNPREMRITIIPKTESAK